MCRRIVLPALVALGICAMFAAPARADIDSGLVTYWPLDGDAADATGDGNSGTMHWPVRPVADRLGHRDSAMYFLDDPNACIELPWGRGLLPRHALTVAAWVRADALAPAGQIVTLQYDPYHPPSCSLRLASGVARFEIAWAGVIPDEPVIIRADSQPLTFGPAQWFHLAGVFRPDEALELWVNGQRAARQPVTMASLFAGSDGSMMVGGPDQPWQGDIDEVRLYARALSPADVNELYTFAPAPHLSAWAPEPADGAVGILVGPVGWKSGATAAFHDLYFGMTPTLGPESFVARLTAPEWVSWPPLERGVTCYWRVDEVEVDGTTIHPGDTWHFTTMPEAPFDPWPADGAKSVSPEMDLRWSPGIGAISYTLHFGTDPNALIKSSSAIYPSRPASTKFDPGLLEPGKICWWRVDEVGKTEADGSAHTRVGPVWSFTTADLPVVDDFESYDDDESYGHHVHDTWLGPVPNVICDPGPCLYPPYLERTIVQSGRQAMVFDYNNVVVPWFSEVQRTRAGTQNWTRGGADTLVLHVRGLATNDPAPFYLVVQDSAGKVAFATHPDPQVLLATTWVEWRIPLSSLTGVNLARVKKVYLGVGDPRTPTPGGLGWVYIDDIRVIKASS